MHSSTGSPGSSGRLRAAPALAGDAADVSQTTWLRLVEHLGRIRDPSESAPWLAATARHECLRVIRHAGRFVADATSILDAVGTDPEPAALLIATERNGRPLEGGRGAPRALPDTDRVLMADPPPSYRDVAAAFDIPIGSIGPTRARCSTS